MISIRFSRREPARRPKTSTRCYNTLPRRPKTPPRRSQDAPRFPRRPQDGPKTGPRDPQDAPRRPPGAEKLGLKSVFLADPHQTSILERLGLDFGRFGDRILQLLQELYGALGSFCDQRPFREPSKCEPPKRAALPVPCQIRFMLGGFWLSLIHI